MQNQKLGNYSNVRHEIEERKHVTFYTLVQLMAAGMYGITVTGDLFNMFIWLEIASLTAYALIAVAGGRALRPAYNLIHLWRWLDLFRHGHPQFR